MDSIERCKSDVGFAMAGGNNLHSEHGYTCAAWLGPTERELGPGVRQDPHPFKLISAVASHRYLHKQTVSRRRISETQWT
jgi:hypothetical protein